MSLHIVVAGLLVIPYAPLFAASELKVHFIDVGQGDSILIDFGTTEILIDGGNKSPGVVSYLNNFVDGPLEVMVATHPHADHIGGLIAVLGSFQVEKIWLNGDDTASTQTYTDFTAAVQAEGATVSTVHRGEQLDVNGLTFKVLNPATLTGDINNNSIVLAFSYGAIDFLFMGDAQQAAESAMLAAGIVPDDVEVLKVGHHGSKTASSPAFLNVAKPEVAIYMAGEGNQYEHPHLETITALNQVGAQIYGTDANGTIVITTDGVSYSVQPQSGANITVTAVLEGELRPLSGYDVPLTFKVYDEPVTTTNITTVAPVATFTTASGNIVITNKNLTTKVITFTVRGVPPGVFSVTLYTPHCLVNHRGGVSVALSGTTIDMGILREGDAKDITEGSKAIDCTDFNRFALAYESSPSGPGWNPLADFDCNGRVELEDFSLLYANYGKSSPQVVQ